MGTITISSSGFAAMPATAPSNWPAGLVYPGAVAPNGSRSATLTDAEMLQLITWAAATKINQPASPTVAQILSAWVGDLFASTRAAIQNWGTTQSAPPQINLN